LKEVRFRSEGGVRQEGILGLFLIFVAMVCIVRSLDKQTEDASLLTSASEKIVLHGDRGVGESFSVNNSLHADDAADFATGRDYLEIDAVDEVEHLAAAGLEARVGQLLGNDKVRASKTEATFFPRQDARCDDYDPVDGLSSSFDGVNLTHLAVSAADSTFVPFTREFCYLGSVLTVGLVDLPGVRNRVRKGFETLFMLKKEVFANPKISRTTKRVACFTLAVMVALRGCESWSVTAEIERVLRSFQQTACMRVTCGVSKRVMREERVSAVSLLQKIGVEGTMHYCRYLQLNCLGTVSRMPSNRVQRKLPSSWMEAPRLSNYPQTCSRSTLEAMASVDVPEAHWQDLARDEVTWNKHARQTDADREKQRLVLFQLHCDKDPSHHAKVLALAAFPVSQDDPPSLSLLPSCPISWTSRFVLPSPGSTPWLEGPLSAPAVSSRGTPVSTRRREFLLGGGTLVPRQARGK
jgi:hypothetical protein